MANPRKKSDLVSKTLLTEVEDWIKEHRYGRRKIIETDAMSKWVECETESIFVLNKALGTNYVKSIYNGDDRMENDRCTWHEDIDSANSPHDNKFEFTIDTKTSYTFDSYPLIEYETEKSYRRQGQWYMRLKWEKYTQHTVAKVLVNTPARILKQDLYRLYTRLQRQYEGMDEFIEREYEKKARALFKQCVYDKQIKIDWGGKILQLTDDLVIPYKERVQTHTFYRDDAAIEKIKQRVDFINDEIIPKYRS